MPPLGRGGRCPDGGWPAASRPGRGSPRRAGDRRARRRRASTRTTGAVRRRDAARPAPDRWSLAPPAACPLRQAAAGSSPQPGRISFEQRAHGRGATPPHPIQETLLGAGIVRRRGHVVPGLRTRPRRAVGRGRAFVGSFHVVPSHACDRFPLKSRPSVRAAAPTVKQYLAALRMLFDWFVTGHFLDMNPAHAVRGPKYVWTQQSQGIGPMRSFRRFRPVSEVSRIGRGGDRRSDRNLRPGKIV